MQSRKTLLYGLNTIITTLTTINLLEPPLLERPPHGPRDLGDVDPGEEAAEVLRDEAVAGAEVQEVAVLGERPAEQLADLGLREDEHGAATQQPANERGVRGEVRAITCDLVGFVS